MGRPSDCACTDVSVPDFRGPWDLLCLDGQHAYGMWQVLGENRLRDEPDGENSPAFGPYGISANNVWWQDGDSYLVFDRAEGAGRVYLIEADIPARSFGEAFDGSPNGSPTKLGVYPGGLRETPGSWYIGCTSEPTVPVTSVELCGKDPATVTITPTSGVPIIISATAIVWPTDGLADFTTWTVSSAAGTTLVTFTGTVAGGVFTPTTVEVVIGDPFPAPGGNFTATGSGAATCGSFDIEMTVNTVDAGGTLRQHRETWTIAIT